MSYRHLFFDLDHTIWDFEQNSRTVLEILYQEYQLSTCGVDCFDTFHRKYEYHNERFWVRFRRGHMTREELRWKRMWHTLLDFKHYDMELAHRLSAVYLTLLPEQRLLVPYAREILDYCAQKNYRLHLITNGYADAQSKKIKSAGIDHYFQEVVTSENSNSLKPNPAIFAYAVQAAGARPEECVMIGDALEADILGAQRYGMDQIYFNPQKKDHAERPTHEIICLSNLRQIL